MRRLYALLTAFQRHGANTLVAFGKAALEKSYRELMLSLRGFKADLLYSAVYSFYRRIQPRVDRFVVGYSPNIGTVKFLPVEECNYSVFELHPGHFSRKRHVADAEFVFTVGREKVFDAEPAA